MIETERLLLRPFEQKDYDDLYEFLDQLRDNEFEGDPDITYEKTAEHLAYRLNTDDFLAIELKSTGRVIGNIYCGKRDFDAREVGYIVNTRFQRQGIALEALTAAVRCFLTAGAHRVYAECDPRNTCSWRLLEKAGFTREAHFRKNIWFHTEPDGSPRWKDTYVYAMLAEDLQAEKK